MSLRFATRLLFVCLLAALTSCKASPPAASNAEVVTIDVAGMDKSVAPGDDFNQYVNGGWLKSTAIPADKPSYGISAILADETRKRTIDLIQTAPGQIGDYYSSFMDEATIEAKGLMPLKPRLDSIAGIKDRQGLVRAIGGNLRADVDPLNATNFQTDNLFGVFIAQGLTDPEHNMPYLLQGGLGMPD